MLISEPYLQTLRRQHEADDSWGDGHAWFVEMAAGLIKETRPKTILDYGCGKGHLKRYIPVAQLYDPGVPEFAARPKGPVDLLLSCCVLEHVEPELLYNVLSDMSSLTKQYALIAVSCFKSGITLPDGRNAHLIVENLDWWLPRLMSHFLVTCARKIGGRRFVFIGRPKVGI